MPHRLFVFSTDDEPTLVELLSFDTKRGETIDIIDEVGDKYLKFGILLLKDKTGAHVEALVKKHREDCEKINMDIVRQWLQGRGAMPVSWKTLTKILKAVKLSVLAQDIIDTMEDLEIANTTYHHLLETVVLHGTASEMKALIQIPCTGMHT